MTEWGQDQGDYRRPQGESELQVNLQCQRTRDWRELYHIWMQLFILYNNLSTYLSFLPTRVGRAASITLPITHKCMYRTWIFRNVHQEYEIFPACIWVCETIVRSCNGSIFLFIGPWANNCYRDLYAHRCIIKLMLHSKYLLLACCMYLFWFSPRFIKRVE